MPVTRRTLLATLAALPLTRLAKADEAPYPNRPIRLVVAATVGSTGDLIARTLAAPVGALLEQPIVIDARGGAAGKIAVDHVTAAAPDGYTLLLANNGTQSIAPASRGVSPSEAAKSLLPVTMLMRSPIMIAVNPRLQVDSLQALVERARSQPDRLSCASSGVGSTSHLASTMLATRAGIRMTHVPYASTAAAVRDVLSGEVPVLFTQPGTIAALLQSGQLRALAVATRQRLASFPDVETMAEAGYPGMEISTWYGIVVPAGTSRAQVARLHAAFARALAAPGIVRQFAAIGMEMIGGTPEHFAAEMEADARRWGELIRVHGEVGEK